MAYSNREYADPFAHEMFAADAAIDERVAFIRRTYAHVFGAILAFIGLEALWFSIPGFAETMLRTMGQSWWMVLIGFMVVHWIADRWAHSGASPGMQYLGLGMFVVAESLIFVPMLMIASWQGGEYVIPTAGFLTLLIFGGLTVVVFLTKQDFSFLRNFLWLGGLIAMGLVLASAFGFMAFNLGTWFTVAMIVLMSGFILYDTSNIIHHYRVDQHVGAALALFASVATLFWYVLRLVAFSDD